jgi:ubiquinone/menaquinone biosynthesis C-methylase UbiE
MDEKERIRVAYKKRKNDETLYSLFHPGQLFMAQQLERTLLRTLFRHGITSLNDKRILEVGCGTGWRLRQFINYGAKPKNLSAVDLQEEALEAAQGINPNIDFRCCDATKLPYPDESFFLVMQFVMFTSILDPQMKRNAAAEMLRVLQPDGLILWYDYYVSKPTNRDVRGIGRREIRNLFPHCTFEFLRVTLAPPLARAIAPHSFLLCYFLEKIPWLCMHYLAVIRKHRHYQ